MAGGRRLRAVGLMFAMSAALSMWISNTATAAMMLPLALGLLSDDDPAHPIGPREKIFVLLGVAYSASIGGIGTLVGSPPNAIAAAQAGIDFAQWMRIGIPMVALLLPLMAGILYVLLRPRLGGQVQVATDGPMQWTRGRRITIVIFGLTAGGWIAATPPNAIVFGTDEVPQSTMMRCGAVLNLACIAVIAAVAAAILG